MTRWLRAVVDNADLRGAWTITDYPLRLARVQTWILAEDVEGGTGGQVALARLVADGPGHPAWIEFEEWCLGRWRRGTFSDLLDGWGVVDIVEPAAPNIEIVRVVAGAEARQIAAGDTVLAHSFLTRFSEGSWAVAGIGRMLPRPGWPPSEVEVHSDLTGPA